MNSSKNRSHKVARLKNRMAWMFLTLSLMTLLLFSKLPNVVNAAAGDLDLAFGTGGLVITDFAAPIEPVTGLGGSGFVANAIVMGHGYSSRDLVTISGAAEPEFDGTFSITVTGPNTFNYILASPATSSAATGSIFVQRQGAIDEATCMAIQADGKIVVAGGTIFRPDTPRDDLSLARYNVDGTLDASFGSGGRVSIPNLGRARGLAIQSDGKILVGGLGIVRFNAFGNLDASFGTSGRVSVGFSVRAIALQADGRIVVTGSSSNHFAVERYNSDGTIDTGFGTGGRATARLGDVDSPGALAIQTDGKIIAAGATTQPTSDTDFALLRLNPDGSPDAAFGDHDINGGNGTVGTGFNHLAAVRSVVVQSDGKIVAAGLASESSVNGNTGRTGFGLVRYHPNGNLDISFGTDGTGRRLTIPSGMVGGEAAAVVALPGGKILAGGFFTAGGPQAFTLVRYDVYGAPDPTFGPSGNGQVVTDFSAGVGGSARVTALGLQPNGFIVAAGTADRFNSVTNHTDRDFALARYNESGPATVCAITRPVDIAVYNDPGMGGAVVAYPPPAASAACGPITCSPASGFFFDVGTTPVMCTEPSGSSTSFNVTVIDNEAPTITSCAPDRAVTADSSCGARIPDLTAEVIATDNFIGAGITIRQFPAPGTLVQIGSPATVTFLVIDDATNVSSCSTRVSAVDRTPPSITRGPRDRTLTATGCQARIPDVTSGVQATDCSPINVSQSPAAGAVVSAGTNTVITVSVSDSEGNVSTSNATIIVQGDTDCDGVANAIDLNKTTAADESQIFSNDFLRQDFAAPATDATLGTILDRGGWNIGVGPSGTYGVFAGISGTGTIAKIQPCDKPYEIHFNTADQQAHLTCDYTTTIPTPDGVDLVTRMRVSAAATPGGIPIEIWRPATSTQAGWRIFADTSAATVYLGSPVTADPNNQSNTRIEFVDAAGNAIGSLELQPSQTVDLRQGDASGLSITNLGTNLLTFTLDGVTHTLNPRENFTDPCAGVSPNQPPTISQPVDLTLNTDPGSISATVQNLVPPTARDRCGRPLTPVGVRSDGRSLTGTYPLGITSITWTAIDQSGRQATAVQNVTVADREPPQIICPSPITVEFTSDEGAVVSFSGTAIDNAPGPLTVNSVPASGSNFPIGMTTVTFNAIDASGNSASCSFTVTVLGSKGVLQNVLNELIALRRNVTNRQVGEKLDRIISDLTEAAGPSFWLDQTHLQPRPASLRVFQKVKESVNKLRWLIDYQRNPIPDVLLQGFINRLVGATRELAVIAINDAVRAGGNGAVISIANDELREGDRNVARGNYESGIEEYVESWIFAQLAIVRRQ